MSESINKTVRDIGPTGKHRKALLGELISPPKDDSAPPSTPEALSLIEDHDQRMNAAAAAGHLGVHGRADTRRVVVTPESTRDSAIAEQIRAFSAKTLLTSPDVTDN